MLHIIAVEQLRQRSSQRDVAVLVCPSWWCYVLCIHEGGGLLWTCYFYTISANILTNSFTITQPIIYFTLCVFPSCCCKNQLTKNKVTSILNSEIDWLCVSGTCMLISMVGYILPARLAPRWHPISSGNFRTEESAGSESVVEVSWIYRPPHDLCVNSRPPRVNTILFITNSSGACSRWKLEKISVTFCTKYQDSWKTMDQDSGAGPGTEGICYRGGHPGRDAFVPFSGSQGSRHYPSHNWY